MNKLKKMLLIFITILGFAVITINVEGKITKIVSVINKTAAPVHISRSIYDGSIEKVVPAFEEMLLGDDMYMDNDFNSSRPHYMTVSRMVLDQICTTMIYANGSGSIIENNKNSIGHFHNDRFRLIIHRDGKLEAEEPYDIYNDKYLERLRDADTILHGIH